jgi:D-glycero-alpha-D-manno-heptose-7-phosphate kinase
VIISRTPYRLSFFGGGTDHPSWYKANESLVISTTIDKYCYVTLRNLPPFFNFNYRLRYFKKEEVNLVNQIKHPVIRECLKLFSYKKGIDLSYIGDIPAMSGVGSSSAFTVSMVNALNTLMGNHSTKRELANSALKIEQDILKENVGSQDQISCSFGGFNIINLHKDKFDVNPISTNSNATKAIEDSVFLLFTGITRNSEKIAKSQIDNIPKSTEILKEMNQLAVQARNMVVSSNFDIKKFGKMMHYQWTLKKNLNIKSSNNLIDKIYKKGIESGAYGGKIIGAGGGGFVLFICNKKAKKKLTEIFKRYLILPIKFEYTGSQIVYYSHS